MPNNKEKFQVFFPEDFPLRPTLKSRFIGKGTYSVDEAADSFGASARMIYKMLDGDQPLYANVEWGLVKFVCRKNQVAGLELVQQLFDTLDLPFEVRHRTHPKVRKSINAICEQLQLLFKEAAEGAGK